LVGLWRIATGFTLALSVLRAIGGFLTAVGALSARPLSAVFILLTRRIIPLTPLLTLRVVSSQLLFSSSQNSIGARRRVGPGLAGRILGGGSAFGARQVI
jgi:hypothetical protein